MSRPSISTPCPAPSRVSSHRLNALPIFDNEDDTSQIDYTRVIQREFAQARPRRPGQRTTNAKVFEDVAEEEDRLERKGDAGGRGMLLGKRPTKRVPMTAIGQGRPSMAPPNKTYERPRISFTRDDTADKNNEEKKKDSRRRTIYVPSDDTTMMTIHPGANTTHRLDDTFQLPAYQPQSLVDCISNSPPSPEEPLHESPAKKPRMSLAAGPRRVPLGRIEAKNLNSPTIDNVGEGGGKENLPPGCTLGDKLAPKAGAGKLAGSPKFANARSRLLETTAASQSRQAVQCRKAVPITRTKSSPRAPVASNFLKARSGEVKGAVKPKSPVEPRAKAPSPRVRAPLLPKPWKNRANYVSASDASKAKLQRYEVLSEDVSRPELYEDSWLDQQEAALTEVINQIFADAEPKSFENAANEQSGRECMLEIYDQPRVAMLHKRLQASLHYGALSRPKDMPSGPDLTHDLGLRRRFVQLWMESYDMDSLGAAAEVVVGRKIPTSSPRESQGAVGSSPKSMDPKQPRRALIGFLETFFVTVDDVDKSHATDEDVQMQRRNKTVLRSLMLIWLLDHAAVSGKQQKRLFKTKSAHKTSASVLNALSSMLMPSIGDISRALRHMDYAVSYTQDLLDEVVFRIDNLAVDLRDGIMLTKLVELLLYLTPSNVWNHQDTTDETVTIVMPDASVLESALYGDDGSQQDRVLVQHLKMPCLGHAQKMYNVDIALQALASHPRTDDLIAANITAETIVNGHRENTLNLLWSLVSSIGLDVLLDRQALIKDIYRLDRTSSELEEKTTDALLQLWAAAYCAPSSIKIHNLTTSFASAAPYAAIVDSFSCFHSPKQTVSSRSTNTNTAASLRALGCSDAFTKQLTSTTTSIPTRQTTLANLAFLASRLLPLAKRHHASAVIQRAFRAKRSWTVLKQRVALMKMAAGCAEVVREQQSVVEAAVVLQRAWRGVVSERVGRLERDVMAFQVVARGWMERRRVGGVKKSGRKAVGW